MYDALNGVSANNLNESSFSYSRKPAMGTGSNNVFNVITVGHKNVAFAAEVSFSTDYRNQVKIELGRGTSKDDFTTQTAYDSFAGNKSLSVPYDGTMVFDFGDLVKSISDVHENYYWKISLCDNTSDRNKVTYKGMRITDNKGNPVNDFSNKSKTIDGKSYAPIAKINLEKGDLNFDRAFDASDEDVLGYYLFGNKKDISYLQRYLGDMDNNDTITTNDIAIFAKILLSDI